MTFAPKEKKFMPAYLAQHFAKHLTNRELQRMGLDSECSPKAPEDAPMFNKLFRTAYIRERTLPGGKKNSLVDMVEAVDRNFKEEVAPEIAAIPKVDALAPDAPPILPPREIAEQEDPSFTRVVTSTTRAPRAGEVNGVHYHFFTPREFDDRVKAGDVLAELHGETEARLDAGEARILASAAIGDVDVPRKPLVLERIA